MSNINANTKKKKNYTNVLRSLEAVFVKLVKSNILIYYYYYRLTHDLLTFGGKFVEIV